MEQIMIRKKVLAASIIIVLISLNVNSGAEEKEAFPENTEYYGQKYNNIQNKDIEKNDIIHYISPSGSTYSNLTEAIDNCSGGETLIIGNGTYDDHVLITVSNLTIIGNSTSDCIFTNNQSFTSNINVSANNFMIMNVGFLTSNHNTTSIRFKGNDLNISHCYFNGTGYFISQVNLSSFSSRIRIHDCEFYQDGYYCKSIYDNSSIDP